MNKKNFYKNKYTNEQKELVKQNVKIVDIAEEFGLTIRNRDKRLAKVVEHDSVVIWTHSNSFNRYSTSVGGDVIKFMEEMPEINMKYSEAMAYLLEKVDPNAKVIQKKETKKAKAEDRDSITFKKNRSKQIMNQLSFDNNVRNAMAYLIQERKIDPDIVKEFVNKGLCKQETNEQGYKSVVFIAYDDLGMVACACKRACSAKSSFKQELTGNDYRYGWLYDPDIDSRLLAYGKDHYDNKKPLVCFESEIEKMSFLTYMKMRGKNINQFAYLSTGSAAKYTTIIDVVKRIGYKQVYIAYNNDLEKFGHKENVGQMYTKKAIDELEKIGVVGKSMCPKYDNDWNDLIRRKKGITDISAIQREVLKQTKARPTINKSKKKEMIVSL